MRYQLLQLRPVTKFSRALCLLFIACIGFSFRSAQAQTGDQRFTFTRDVPIFVPSLDQEDGEGKATPYPLEIVVSGYTGVISDMAFTIAGINHFYPDDLDILLVSPTGIPVMVMSDACGSTPASGVNLAIMDFVVNTSYANLPDTSACVTNTPYRPVNWDDIEIMPSPAPAPPYYNRMSLFHGLDPNGTWKVYIYDDAFGNSGSIDSIALDIYTTPSLPNLIQNGNFGSGETNWQEFGSGSGSVVSGVYQFQRTSPTDAFTVFQTMTADFPEKTPFELRFDMGNSDSQQKRITVLMWDAAFGRQRACSFWLDPNQPLRTYQLIGDVPNGETWDDVTVHFYASSVRTNTNGRFRLDNVVLRRRDDQPLYDGEIYETFCIDAGAPPGDTDIPFGNGLLTNPDFDDFPGGSAENAWALVGNIFGALGDGPLMIQRTGDPAGSLLQNTNFPVPEDKMLELFMDIGNAANEWQRVTVLLHNESFAGLQFCTFWLPPNSPASEGYLIRTAANQTWASEGLSVSVYPSTSLAPILVDNFFLRTGNTKIVGTECYEPGSPQVASLTDRPQDAGFDAFEMPMLLPTVMWMPYVAPNAVGELPIIATPSAPIESDSPSEGTIGE